MIGPDEFVRRSEVEALLRTSQLGLRFAVVTGVSPLRVHLDGDPGALPITPITMVRVAVGDAVLVAMLPNPDPVRASKRPVVLAVVGGKPTAPFREWYALAMVTVTNGAGATNVSFPPNVFTTTPLVQATKQSGVAARYTPYVTGVTATGCTVGLYDPTQTTQAALAVPVGIHVVQASANAAGGIPQA